MAGLIYERRAWVGLVTSYFAVCPVPRATDGDGIGLDDSENAGVRPRIIEAAMCMALPIV